MAGAFSDDRPDPLDAGGLRKHPAAMADDGKQPAQRAFGTAAATEAKERRLAAALRANLGRRKAQARQRARPSPAVAEKPEDDA